MTTAERLAVLAQRWQLEPGQIDRLATVLAVLAADATAPTSVRDAAAVDVHVADSLTALAIPAVRDARSIADLGSGAGFPGVVLAIALGQARVALVESVGRKCAFLARLCQAAGIENVDVVHDRVETWTEGQDSRDLVVARAVAELPVLCEYSAPLLRQGGALVAWKARVPESEAAAGDRAAALLGLQAGKVVRTEPYAGSVGHHLHVFCKVAPTPPGFPRRTGVASKRPLGAMT